MPSSSLAGITRELTADRSCNAAVELLLPRGYCVQCVVLCREWKSVGCVLTRSGPAQPLGGLGTLGFRVGTWTRRDLGEALHPERVPLTSLAWHGGVSEGRTRFEAEKSYAEEIGGSPRGQA